MRASSSTAARRPHWPIANPTRSDWGRKQLSAYLGDDESCWADHDATILLEEKGWKGEILVDQGSSDQFLDLLRPEALAEACGKMMPGFGEQMRRASLDAGVPTAILSRQTAGILDKSLVVTLPGKPGSIRVCLDAIFPAIPYCIDLIGGAYLEGDPDVVQVFRPKAK